MQAQEDLREQMLAEDWADEYLRRCARTLWHLDAPVGVMGINPMWKGVAQVWAFLSPEILAHPFGVSKATLRLLVEAERDFSLHRLQATSRCDFHRATGFLRFLGFQIEGKLRQYAPDQSDYFLWGRVRNTP